MSQIGDLVASSGLSMPSMQGAMAGAGGIFVLILVGGILAFFTWWILDFLTYGKKIIIFGKVGQRYEPIGRDKAKEFTIGDGGEKVLFLKKGKIWKVGEKQASRNTYWFAILPDGYWYNITLGDLDKELGEFKVTGISPQMHKLMRFQNSGLRKNLKDRHIKKKWYEMPIVGWIGAIVFVLVTGIMFIMIGKQYFQLIPQTLGSLNTVLERTNNLLEAAANLCPKG